MSSPPQASPDIGAILMLDGLTSRRVRWRRWMIAALVPVLAFLAITSWPRADQPGASRYDTREVQRGDLVIAVTATGTLEPTNKVVVGSELSGIIKTVEVDYNARVELNQVLATIDTSKLKSQVAQSRAALAVAQAKAMRAQATVTETFQKVKSLRSLIARRAVSQEDVDTGEANHERAKAEEAIAKAEVLQAQAILEANETDLTKAVIRSPISGIVLIRSCEPGQTVAAAFQPPVLFTLAEDLTQIKLQVDVDEADVSQIREGQEATFTVDAHPDRTFRARITQCRYGAKTVGGVVTYETVLKVDNSNHLLRPGMTATAQIAAKEIKDAVLVPSAALEFVPPIQEKKRRSGSLADMLLPAPPSQSAAGESNTGSAGGARQVWVLKDGEPVAVPVTVGATDGARTEILAPDIAPGTRMVVGLLDTAR